MGIRVEDSWIMRHIKIKAQVNPYDPVWADYLKACVYALSLMSIISSPQHGLPVKFIFWTPDETDKYLPQLLRFP